MPSHQYFRVRLQALRTKVLRCLIVKGEIMYIPKFHESILEDLSKIIEVAL